MNLRMKRCVFGLMTWAALTGGAIAQSPTESEGTVRLGTPPVVPTAQAEAILAQPAEAAIGNALQSGPLSAATEGAVQLGGQPSTVPPLQSLDPYQYPGNPGSNFGYNSVDRVFQPRFNVDSRGGGLYGYNAGYSTIGAFIPFAIEGDESLLFVDARGLVTYDGGGGGNLGAGWRWWDQSRDRITGLSAWYDNSAGGIGSNFNQLGLSFESLGRYIDYRINGYIPAGQHDHFGASALNLNPVFYQSNIAFQRTTMTAQAFTGFDIETGGPLPILGRYGFTGYVGGYHFMGAGVGGGSFTGISGRFLTQINEDVSFGMQMTGDHTFGLNTQFQVFVTLPDGVPSRWMRNFRVKDRLTQSVFRQFRAITHVEAVKTFDLAINPTTDKPYFVAHVNPNLSTAGDGTDAHPFNTIAQFNNLPFGLKSQYDIILVNPNTNSTDNGLNTGVQLLNNQRLLSTGLAHTFTTTLGTFTLPTDGPAGTPILSNTGLSGSAVVTLANNNEVSGFKIDGTGLGVAGANSGIVSQAGGIVGFNINHNTIQNALAGVNITNTGTALGLITNNAVNGAGADSALGFQVINTAGNLSLLMQNNSVSNVTGTTLAPGTAINVESNGANSLIIADNPSPAPATPATQATGIDTNTVSVVGGGNGISLSANNGGKFALVVSNNSVTGDWTTTSANQTNTGFGISVAANTGGVVNLFQYLNNTTTSVYGDGARLAANSGGVLALGDGDLTTDDSLTGNTFQNNAGDGLFVGANNGLVVMEDILNYTFSGNGKNGLEFNLQNGGVITVGNGTGNNLITGNTFTSNGADGVLISATGGSAITAVFGDPTVAGVVTNTFAGNGADNVHVIADGAGTLVKTLFTGLTVNGAGTNGFEFNASGGSQLYAEMTGGIAANNNLGGSGVKFLATDAGTQAILFMEETNGTNSFNNNGVSAVGTAFNPVAAAGVWYDAQNVAVAGLRFMGTANSNGNVANTNNDVNADGIGDSDGLFFNVNGAATTALEIAGTTTNSTTFNSNVNLGLGIFLNNTSLGTATVPAIAGMPSQTLGSTGLVLDHLVADSNKGDGIGITLKNLIGTPDVNITNNEAVTNGGNGFSVDLENSSINNLVVQNNTGFLANPQQYQYALQVTNISPGGLGPWSVFSFTNRSATPGIDITSIDVNLAGTAGNGTAGIGGLVYDTAATSVADFAASPLNLLAAANMTGVGITQVGGTNIVLNNPIPTSLATGLALPGGGVLDKGQDLNLSFVGPPTTPAFGPNQSFSYRLGMVNSVSNLTHATPNELDGAVVTVNFSNGQSLQNVLSGGNNNILNFVSPVGATAANGIDGLHIVQNNSNINNVLIDHNVLSNNTQDGINFAKITNSTIGSATITNNDLGSNQANGLAFTRIDGASQVNNVTIASNNITNNGVVSGTGNGISMFVTGTDSTTFSQINNLVIGGPTLADQNIITGNAGDGIQISRSSYGEVNNATIENNLIQLNTGNGINISAAHATLAAFDGYTINNNNIDQNGINGILIHVESDAVVNVNMDGNTITNNGLNGIQTTELVNTGSDLREVEGIWTRNTITGNGADGIQLAAHSGNQTTGDILVIGDPLDTTLGNKINNNGQNGVNVIGSGVILIGNNQIDSNGTVGTVSTANQTAGINAQVAPFNNLTIINNEIENNHGDGITYGIRQGFSGFLSQAQIIGNNVAFNDGRGLNILNGGSNEIDVVVTNNIFNANLLEGVYIVNTSSRTQTIWASSDTPMAQDGGLFASPIIQMQFANNQVIGNGQSTASYAQPPDTTGLVVRVGTSDGGYAYNNPGGFASTGGVALGASPIGTSTGWGGVTMTVDNNVFGGNQGDDVTFKSFVSSGTSGGTGTKWDNTTFDPRGYQGDPLSRLDLYFRGNTFDTENVNNAYFNTGVGGGNTSYVAYFNNADGTFKSRLNSIKAPDLAGPFNTDTRDRNAQRQAARYNLPPSTVPPTPGFDFLYPGMGDSTFRVNTDDPGIFLIDSPSPMTNYFDANGVFIQNGQGEPNNMPFGWGALP